MNKRILIYILICLINIQCSSNNISQEQTLSSHQGTSSNKSVYTDFDTSRLMPTTSDGISLIQIPHYENSSPWGGIMDMTDNGLLLYGSETGMYYLDLNNSSDIWHRVYPSNGTNGYDGIAGNGVTSAQADPANADVVYFCNGTKGQFLTNGNIDAFTYADMGAIYRSTDNLETSTMLTGQNDAWERLVLACPDGGYARYIYDDEIATDGWVLANHAPLFAFDDRETVTSGGKTVSKNIYFMTHTFGLYRGTFSDDGTSLSWTSIDMYPSIVDDGGTSGAFGDAGISQDLFYFQYEPQHSATDRRSTYPYDGDCDEDGDGDEDGTYDGTECVEDEIQGVGTVVLLDPVYHNYNKQAGISNSAIIWSGYFINPIWQHGGLRRIKIDSTGIVTDTQEITYAGDSLDVHDIVCDETQSVTLRSTNEKVAKYCYVAAGRNGVFKITTDSRERITIEDIGNDDGSFDFLTRNRYLAECAAGTRTSCTDTVSYQSAGIDQAYIDGQSYLLLVTSSGIYYTIEDFTNPIAWHDISGIGRSWRGMIDSERKKFYVGSADELMQIDINQLTESDTPWENLSHFADRSGFRLMFDPTVEDTLHFTDLDGTYGYYKLNDNLEITDTRYADTVRTAEVNLCYGMIYGDATALDADNNGRLDANYTGTIYHYNSYGDRVLFAKNSNNENVMYVSSNYFNGYDGAIHHCSWDSDGVLDCELATGDNSCETKFWKWNASMNSCVAVCDPAGSPNPLPAMSMGGLAVDPRNSDHLIVIGWDGTTNHMYESTDGGENWTNRDSWYVYGSTRGPSMQNFSPSGAASQSKIVDLVWDPQDSNIVYVTYYSAYGVFKLDLSAHYLTDITNIDITADNNANAQTMGSKTGATYSTLGSSKYYMPFARDIEASIDPTTGKTRLYLASTPFCDVGWGRWPESTCTTSNGGGIYSRLVDADPAIDATLKWNKLTYASEELRYFMGYALAISPIDPNYIVAVGNNDFGWSSAGNPTNLSAGVIYSKDGGATWKKVTDLTINASSVTADPFDKNRFMVGIAGSGMWLLDLDSSFVTGSTSQTTAGTTPVTTNSNNPEQTGENHTIESVPNPSSPMDMGGGGCSLQIIK